MFSPDFQHDNFHSPSRGSRSHKISEVPCDFYVLEQSFISLFIYVGRIVVGAFISISFYS